MEELLLNSTNKLGMVAAAAAVAVLKDIGMNNMLLENNNRSYNIDSSNYSVFANTGISNSINLFAEDIINKAAVASTAAAAVAAAAVNNSIINFGISENNYFNNNSNKYNFSYNNNAFVNKFNESSNTAGNNIRNFIIGNNVTNFGAINNDTSTITNLNGINTTNSNINIGGVNTVIYNSDNNDNSNIYFNTFGNSTDNVVTSFNITEYLGPQRDSLYIVIPITIIYVIIFITGVIGNISTCIVIKKNRSMHTATNYYLFSLAISDFLLLLSGVPQEIYFIWSKYPYVFGEAFCIGRGFIAETSANATILTITAFTVERYVAICHPFLSHAMSKLNRATRIILLIWFTSFLTAIPQAAQFGLINVSGITRCAVVRVIIEHSFQLSTFIFFFAPMSIILVLYLLIGLKLHQTSVMRTTNGNILYRAASAHTMRTQNHQGTRRVLKMLVAVVIAFFICWAPFHAQRLIAVYGVTDETNHDPVIVILYTVMTYVSGILYYLSTCINPLLYNIMSNKFREAFKETLENWNFFASKTTKPKQKYNFLSRSQRMRTAFQGSYDYTSSSQREESVQSCTSSWKYNDSMTSSQYRNLAFYNQGSTGTMATATMATTTGILSTSASISLSVPASATNTEAGDTSGRPSRKERQQFGECYSVSQRKYHQYPKKNEIINKFDDLINVREDQQTQQNQNQHHHQQQQQQHQLRQQQFHERQPSRDSIIKIDEIDLPSKDALLNVVYTKQGNIQIRLLQKSQKGKKKMKKKSTIMSSTKENNRTLKRLSSRLASILKFSPKRKNIGFYTPPLNDSPPSYNYFHCNSNSRKGSLISSSSFRQFQEQQNQDYFQRQRQDEKQIQLEHQKRFNEILERTPGNQSIFQCCSNSNY